jgi:predicted AAA+ superfamily ATPase
MNRVVSYGWERGDSMNQRIEYLEKLIAWREKQLIKVVTGVRRCGKSTLFQLYIEYLKSSGVLDEQIVFINLEDIRFEHLLDYRSLHEYVLSRLYPSGFTYVFIDEVQQCRSFEKAVDSLLLRDRVDIHITGSNAHLLSGELATLLSGRYVEIGMLPLSFAEYLDFTGQSKLKTGTSFNDYLKYGSFPLVATLQKEDTVLSTYLDGIYNTILIKDVAVRQAVHDIAVLESIVKFLCSSIGSPVSAKRISDAINSSGRRISVNTVDRYLRALTDSYFFYKVDRYDIRGKQFLKTLGKYYIVDTGIRNLLISGSTSDLGHQLENIVYLELVRRGYKVSIGKLDEKEVDFVASNPDGILYFQVSASVLDGATLSRELAPLRRIPDHHPRYLLTLDEVMPNSNYDGIRQVNLIDWILKRN